MTEKELAAPNEPVNPDAPVHMSPPEGSDVLPCCGKTPFEIPRTDRITLEESEVTCVKDKGKRSTGGVCHHCERPIMTDEETRTVHTSCDKRLDVWYIVSMTVMSIALGYLLNREWER